MQSLFKNPIVHQLWTARQEAKRLQKNSKSQTCSLGKPPSASRVEVSYLFSKDELLMETYRNPWGQMVRFVVDDVLVEVVVCMLGSTGICPALYL